VHLAPTREQAEAEVRDGVFEFAKVLETYQSIGSTEWTASPDAAVRHWRENGFTAFGMGIIGTPDDAIARIEDFVAQSGGFGTFLLVAHNTASWEATLRSYDLFARYVVPHFRRSNAARRESLAWCHDNATAYFPGMIKSIEEATGVSHHLPGMPTTGAAN
jgi:limonene 1,2-monooxygenase